MSDYRLMHEATAALLEAAAPHLALPRPALAVDPQSRHFIANPAFADSFAWAGPCVPLAIGHAPPAPFWDTLLARVREDPGMGEFFQPSLVGNPQARPGGPGHWRFDWRRRTAGQAAIVLVTFTPALLQPAEARQFALAGLARALAHGCAPAALARLLRECGCAGHGVALYRFDPGAAVATLLCEEATGDIDLPASVPLEQPGSWPAPTLAWALGAGRPLLLRREHAPALVPGDAAGVALVPLPGATGAVLVGLDREQMGDQGHGVFLDLVARSLGAALARAVAPALAAADGAERARVLLIDDDPLLVAHVRHVLRRAFDVDGATNAQDGLARALAAPPDLILVDLVMPGLSGIELLRAIRRHPVIRTVPVIMLSGRGDEAACVDALAAGADDYVAKPFSARELGARIRAHVELVRLRRDSARRESELLHTIRSVRHDFERVLADTSDAFLSIDHELRVVALNAVAARLLDGGAGSPVGAPLAQVAPDLCATFGTQLSRVLAEQVVLEGEYHAASSGTWYGIRAYPSMGGVVLLGADISRAKLAAMALQREHSALEERAALSHAQLHAANALLSAVFHRAPAGIVLAGMDGRYLRVNRAYRALVGYDERELSAHTLESFVEPADRAAKHAALARLRAGTCDAVEMEVRHRCKDGRLITCASFVSMIVDQGGASYFVKTSWDITDRKHAEQRLRRSREELRALLETLHSVRADESRRLAREVHDQLGQVLTAALIDLELLESDVNDPGRALGVSELVHELRSAKANVERAIGTVQEIALSLRPPELAEHGLAEALRWHARDFERRTRIACTVRHLADGYREPPAAIAVELFRLCQEALTNVVRHAAAGAVLVDLRCRGGQLLVRIADNGRGIDKACVDDLRSIGLRGMRERAAVGRGSVRISGRAGRGTLVAVRVRLVHDAGRQG